jgi:hypothetical protein
MKKLLLALAATALLVGCVRMDKSPPKDLPDYAQLYPGAQPMMHMDVGPLSSEIFQVSATPDQVLDFYRSQAASNGLTEQPAKTSPAEGQRQATFADPSNGRMLVVVAKTQGGVTIVSLGYKPQPKSPS